MLQIIAVAIVLCVDQLVKYLVRMNVGLYEYRPFIKGFVSLTHYENEGAAFSILQGMRWPLIVVTSIFIVLVIFIVGKKIISHPLGVWSLTAVAAGAGGNLIDRIFHGYVTDMFSFDFMTFAVFNVADIFVVCGGILACVYLIFFHSEKTDEKVSADEPDDNDERTEG